MMGLTDQWNRADYNAELLTGGEGGGGGGNVEEDVCVCVCVWEGGMAMPPSAASAVMDLPSKLTSVAQSDSHGTRWWELPAMSVIFYFRSFHPVRLQWPAMQAPTPETCMDDLRKNQWVMNTHVSASHQGLDPCMGSQYCAVSEAGKVLQWNVKVFYSTV